MDIAKEYSCLEQNRRIYNKTLDKDDSFQETLPAYCDDLYRVIKCTSHSYITSVDINYNEVKIFGKTQICLTYYDEASNLCYVDFDEELNLSVDVENLTDSAFAVVNSFDKYCSFRVINQRRIDFHTACSIDLQIYDKVSLPCLSSCENSKLKRDEFDVANIISSCQNKVEFDEELPLPTDSPSVKRIISSTANVTIDETKIIKDKALIKANVNAQILYTADGENEEILKITHSFSLSRIVDSMGIDENDLIIANAQTAGLYTKLKHNASQQMAVIELYGDITISSIFIRESKQLIVSDGYIVNRPCNCNYLPYTFNSNGTFINETVAQTLSFNFSNDIKEIKELSLTVGSIAIKGNSLLANVNANCICIADEALVYLSNTVQCELGSYQNDSGFAFLSISNFDYTLKSSGKVDVRINANLFGYMFGESTVNVLTEIEADDKMIDYPALTVYFGKKDETVWNIAKNFSSDIDMIKQENELQNDVLDSNKILIIPGI